jgi:hypothetical protein
VIEDSNEQTLYDLAPDQPVTAAPRRRVGNPAPPASSSVIGYRSAGGGAKPASPEAIRDLWLPLWLLVGSVVTELLTGILFPRRLGGSPADVIATLVVGTPLLLLAVWITAKIRQIELGPVGAALFKLAAIAIAPGALVDLCGGILQFVPLGFLIGWLVQFVALFTLLGVMFDLDQSDTWYCVCVIFLVRLGVAFAAAAVLN